MTLGLGDIDFGYICAGCHLFIRYGECHDCEGFDTGSAEGYPKIFETEENKMLNTDPGYTYATAGPGYTCPNCYSFVPWNESHSCGFSFPSYTPPYPYPEPRNTNPPVYVDPMVEINRKLDEILELLKEIA